MSGAMIERGAEVRRIGKDGVERRTKQDHKLTLYCLLRHHPSSSHLAVEINYFVRVSWMSSPSDDGETVTFRPASLLTSCAESWAVAHRVRLDFGLGKTSPVRTYYTSARNDEIEQTIVGCAHHA